MKKIGFIDLFIDEWHANNYPGFIRNSEFKDKFNVAMAWEESAPEGKKPLDVWCRENNVEKASSIPEVVEKCDCIVVLAPSNPETHERLAEIPLASGKPLYIDKAFAPNLETARRLFSKAEKYNTPLMSSSALRFGSAIGKALSENSIDGTKADFVNVRGGGRSFDEYAIHQVEMLVMAMGTGATRVMHCGKNPCEVMVVEYCDGRRAVVNLIPSQAFALSIQYKNGKFININEMSDFFPLFINSMLSFFDTGKSCVPKEETLQTIAILDSGIQALKTPDKWVKVSLV
ncbi:MAG TPA: oxidoreductase [Lentisphaeria bacterium]|nr:MAG: oxidoreductase [Lentisphaerae bacterium GWF2_50_93]HCE44040.1 oxidoreductase [Lentisphaeria bacterium]